MKKLFNKIKTGNKIVDEIFLSISGYDREIAVDRSELKKALSII